MKIYEETTLDDFNFWGGAREFTNRLNCDEWDILEAYFNEIYPDGITNTDLNDIFWFETEMLLDVLDISEEEFWNR